MDTVMACTMKADVLVALVESRRNCAPTRASRAALFSHLRWMGASAPRAFRVSKPTNPSTSVALRWAPAR